MFNTLLHHQKSRLVSILNLVMIDLFCLYVVGVHSFLCLSVGAQVWTILVVFSRNQLKCALILYSRDLFKNALKNYAVAICWKAPEIGTGTMLCRCISRMTSFVPFMRGGLRFMALPCCLVHCEVRQTQSSLHHSTRHSSTIAFQFHPSSQYTLPPPHNLLYLPSFVSARTCPCIIGGKSLCAYSFLLLIKIYDQPFLL